MKSNKVGSGTSVAEVTNISSHGVWILADGHEYFAPYDKFPWFKGATLSAVQNVEFSHGHLLSWPDLDVDLSLEILTNPGSFRLMVGN